MEEFEHVTAEWIRGEVRDLAKLGTDDEAAHSGEDELRDTVLRAIAAGANDPQELAREVIKTSDLHFSRWYA